MAETCTSLGNTGSISCPFLLNVIARTILVPKYASDGTVNKIDSGDLTKAVLQAHFDNAEKLDRYYPTPILKNVTNERADPEFFEWDGGGSEFVREGVRAFTGMISKGTPELEGRLNQWNGQEMGFYAFDVDGNFIYKDAGDGSGDYLPIPIDGGSMYTGFKWKTNSDPSMLAVQFNVKDKFKDEELRYTKASELDFDGLDSGDVYGLNEITVNITAATATTGTFTLSQDMGVALSGMLIGNFVAHNDTDDTAVTLTAVTESGVNAGTYAWTNSTGLTTGDTVRITVSKTKLSHTYDTFVTTA